MISISNSKTCIDTPRTGQEGLIRLELEANTLLRLIEERQLCAADFHCLDYKSKQYVWKLCLTACIKCMESEPAP